MSLVGIRFTTARADARARSKCCCGSGRAHRAPSHTAGIQAAAGGEIEDFGAFERAGAAHEA